MFWQSEGQKKRCVPVPCILEPLVKSSISAVLCHHLLNGGSSKNIITEMLHSPVRHVSTCFRMSITSQLLLQRTVIILGHLSSTALSKKKKKRKRAQNNYDFPKETRYFTVNLGQEPRYP